MNQKLRFYTLICSAWGARHKYILLLRAKHTISFVYFTGLPPSMGNFMMSFSSACLPVCLFTLVPRKKRYLFFSDFCTMLGVNNCQKLIELNFLENSAISRQKGLKMDEKKNLHFSWQTFLFEVPERSQEERLHCSSFSGSNFTFSKTLVFTVVAQNTLAQCNSRIL